MAFGGVETGNTKAKLAAMQTPKVGGTGETFADWAIAITTGTSMLAAAVLEANSVKIRVVPIGTAVKLHKAFSPIRATIPLPTASASPVFTMR